MGLFIYRLLFLVTSDQWCVCIIYVVESLTLNLTRLSCFGPLSRVLSQLSGVFLNPVFIKVR